CSHRVSGAHRWTTRFNENGDPVERAFFGVHRQPIATRDGGYHRVAWEYQGKGRAVQEDHLGLGGKHVVDHRGAARIRYRHDSAGKVVEQTFWKVNREGELVFWKRENEQGRLVEETNLTADGEPQMWPERYSRRKLRYDPRGNTVEEAYFDLKD